MIEVTESASKAIKAFMQEKQLDSALRVYLQAGGWSGPSLRLVLDEPKDNDDKYEVGGLTYLIGKDLSVQSGDVKVDFINNGWQQGFVLSTAHPMGGGGSCGSTSCSC